MSQVLEKKSSSFIDSEEFRIAVQEAASKAAAEAVAVALSAKSQSGSDAISIAQAIAAEMSKLTAGADGRHRFPAEQLQSMKVAKENMLALIKQYKESNVIPRYKLIAKAVFGQKMFEPSVIGKGGAYRPRTFGWVDIPNEAMVPINEPARRIYDEFKNYICISADPVPKEDIWINDNGMVMYGKNPARDTTSERPKAHPNLLEDGDLHEMTESAHPSFDKSMDFINKNSAGPFYVDGYSNDPALSAFGG